MNHYSDVEPHWNEHVQIDKDGNLIGWQDHKGCYYCSVLSGRMAKWARR